MALLWLSCPHCAVHFQIDTSKGSAPQQCPACRGTLNSSAPTSPARKVAEPNGPKVFRPANRPSLPRARVVAVPAAKPAIAEPARPPVVSPPSPGWFYASNKKKHGPVQLAQLRQLAAGGQLQPTDMILQEGTQKWVAARALPGLFPAPSPASAPAVRPAPALSRSDAHVNHTSTAVKPAPPNAASTQSLPAPTGWHYAKNKKKLGPVQRKELQRLASIGELLPSDMVLPEGSGEVGGGGHRQ